jgi:hypothetical protein
MVSSVGDLFRWHRALQGDRVLPAESRRRMLVPHAEGYAYGWYVQADSAGRPAVVFHNGLSGDFLSAMRHYVPSDVFMAATTNVRLQDASDRHDQMLNMLWFLVRGRPVPTPPAALPPSAAGLARIEGVYETPNAVRFVVRRHAPDRLWLAPVGQAAFDALWGRDPDHMRQGHRAAERTLTVIDSLRHAGCADITGPAGMLCELTSRLGPLRDVELLGAAPLTWSDDWTQTYTRLRLSRGSQVVTWEWDGDALVKTRTAPGVAHPQAVPLARTSDSTFVHHDWFTGRTVRVLFDLPRHGNQGQLIVRAPWGSVRAYRVAGVE